MPQRLTLTALRERLEAIRVADLMARTLATQASRLAEAVRAGMHQEGASHERPWVQTGALQESIGSIAEGLSAAVRSSDPAAMPQEMGTAHLPPRPFLAPVGAAMAEEIAGAVGEAVTAALRGEPSNEPGDVDATEASQETTFTLASASNAFARNARPNEIIPVASANDPWGNKTAADAARQAGLTTKEERQRFHRLITK